MSTANQAEVANKRTLLGRVTSDKRAKTVTVVVERQLQHPLYGKLIAKSTKYQAHTETGDVKTGDLVEIQESRPLSKTKNWVVVRLVEKARVI